MKYFYFVFLLFITQLSFTQNTIETQKVIKNDSLYVHFINPFYAPVEFKITVKDSIKDSIKIIPKLNIKAKDTVRNVFVIPLSMVKDTSKISLSNYAKTKGTLGKSKIVPDYNYKYALPYPKEKSYKIMQTFGGKFSHNVKHSKYAIDFTMPIGDTITASREGTVVFIIDHFKEHGGRDFMGKANKIVVIHDDGTFAHYVHLDYKGVLVKGGDYITKGQPIGLSGHTGFSTKPHLHLVIYKENSESIPFYFEKIGKKKLKQGKYYKNK